MLTLSEVLKKVESLERNFKNLATRNYGERAEKALSESVRVETKEDNAVADLDDGIAEVMLMIVDVMKGE